MKGMVCGKGGEKREFTENGPNGFVLQRAGYSEAIQLSQGWPSHLLM